MIMLKTVTCIILTVFVIILCSENCASLVINSAIDYGVNEYEDYADNPFPPIEPVIETNNKFDNQLSSNENKHVDFIIEEATAKIDETFEVNEKLALLQRNSNNTNELKKNNTQRNSVTKKRVVRQVNTAAWNLYPQLPTTPSYNQYPSYSPGYKPTNSSYPYNPSSGQYYSTYNNSQQSNPSYTPSYRPTNSSSPYGPQSHGFSKPNFPYNPSSQKPPYYPYNGQHYPYNNTQPSYPSYTPNYRPDNFSGPYDPSSQRPSNFSSYPYNPSSQKPPYYPSNGQHYPYNNTQPSYPSYTPTYRPINSSRPYGPSSQRPPYYPSSGQQYPYNNTQPIYPSYTPSNRPANFSNPYNPIINNNPLYHQNSSNGQHYPSYDNSQTRFQSNTSNYGRENYSRNVPLNPFDPSNGLYNSPNNNSHPSYQSDYRPHNYPYNPPNNSFNQRPYNPPPSGQYPLNTNANTHYPPYSPSAPPK